MPLIEGPKCKHCGRYIPRWRAPGFALHLSHEWAEPSERTWPYPDWYCQHCVGLSEIGDDDDALHNYSADTEDEGYEPEDDEAEEPDTDSYAEEWDRGERESIASEWNDYAEMVSDDDGVWPDEDRSDDPDAGYMPLRGLGIEVQGL